MRDGLPPFAVLYPGDGSPDNAVLRCLGEAGAPVALATARRVVANAASRYCARWFRVPPPEKGAAAVVDRLIEVAADLGGRPVLFLLHDLAVMLGARFRDRLSASYRGDFLEEDLLEVCNRQARTCAAAADAGIPVPATVAWPGADRAEVHAVPKPCVVKPMSKYVASGDHLWIEPFLRRFGRKALLARSDAELAAILDRCLAEGVPVVVQEHIPGPVTHLITVVLQAADGAVTASFAGRKLRQSPPDCGTCTYGETCWDAEEATDLAARFVAAVGYHGVGEIEFKRDARDARLKLVEINPRATIFCLIAAAHGVNLPLMAYSRLTGRAPAATPAARRRDVVRWMDPYRDLLQSSRTPDGGRVSLRRWVAQLREADLLCWGGRRDPLPLLLAPAQGACEWLGDRLRLTRPPAIARPKGPGDDGYLGYWEKRSHQTGLRAVMWNNEDYNRLADAQQKQLLDAALGDLSGRTALDFCCGTGRLSVHLARNGADVVGVDLPGMAAAAQHTNPHPRVRYVGGDAGALDLPAATFDVILSVGTLPCVCSTPDELSAMTAKLRGLLKPGGRLVTMEPWHVCPVIRRPLKMSPREAVALLERGGFRLLAQRPLLCQVSWMTLARPWWRAPRPVTAALFKLGEALLKVPGAGWMSDYKMFVLEKTAR